MLRTIIKIDDEKCNGCGLCVDACHEGAIELIEGKAALIRDDYCDGLGNCLPVCPTNAISFEEREALAFDEIAVQKKIEAEKFNSNKVTEVTKHASTNKPTSTFSGCPGSRVTVMNRDTSNKATKATADSSVTIASQLNQWPVQIKLVAPNAPYFTDCDLLIAADCTAFSYGNFHNDFMKGMTTLIGCPKLDDVDYSNKLTDIIANNSIRSITVIRMIVPCCGGIEYAVKLAITNSKKTIPCKVVTLSTEGSIV